MRETQRIKVLKIWIEKQAKMPDTYFFPQDLIAGGTHFVGYEISARLSEIQKEYPKMVESITSGRFVCRRLRLKDTKEWLPTLPSDVRKVVEAELDRNGVRFVVTVTVPVIDEVTKSVRFEEREQDHATTKSLFQ